MSATEKMARSKCPKKKSGQARLAKLKDRVSRSMERDHAPLLPDGSNYHHPKRHSKDFEWSCAQIVYICVAVPIFFGLVFLYGRSRYGTIFVDKEAEFNFRPANHEMTYTIAILLLLLFFPRRSRGGGANAGGRGGEQAQQVQSPEPNEQVANTGLTGTPDKNTPEDGSSSSAPCLAATRSFNVDSEEDDLETASDATTFLHHREPTSPLAMGEADREDQQGDLLTGTTAEVQHPACGEAEAQTDPTEDSTSKGEENPNEGAASARAVRAPSPRVSTSSSIVLKRSASQQLVATPLPGAGGGRGVKSSAQQHLQKSPVIPQEPRLHYLDNLKSLLIFAVVSGHTGIMFGPNGNNEAWHLFNFKDNYFAWIASSIVICVANIVMPVFFFIAGLMTPSSLEKQGVHQFARKRLQRYGLPLLLTFFLLWPLHQSFVYKAVVFPRLHDKHKLDPKTGEEVGFSVFDSLTTDTHFAWFLQLLTAICLGFAVVCPRGLADVPTMREVPSFARMVLYSVVLAVLAGWMAYADCTIWNLSNNPGAGAPVAIFFFLVGVTAKKNHWLVRDNTLVTIKLKEDQEDSKAGERSSSSTKGEKRANDNEPEKEHDREPLLQRGEQQAQVAGKKSDEAPFDGEGSNDYDKQFAQRRLKSLRCQIVALYVCSAVWVVVLLGVPIVIARYPPYHFPPGHEAGKPTLFTAAMFAAVSLPTIFLATSVVRIFAQSCNKTNSFLKFLADASFGVYFLHQFVLDFVAYGWMSLVELACRMERERAANLKEGPRGGLLLPADSDYQSVFLSGRSFLWHLMGLGDYGLHYKHEDANVVMPEMVDKFMFAEKGLQGVGLTDGAHEKADPEWGYGSLISATQLNSGGITLGFVYVVVFVNLVVWPLIWALRKIPGAKQIL
eukprot:g9346.t1